MMSLETVQHCDLLPRTAVVPKGQGDLARTITKEDLARRLYSDHVVDIPADAISPEFIKEMGSLIRRVADEKPALVVPSGTECGFCPITLEDCPQRVSVPEEAAVANRFDSGSPTFRFYDSLAKSAEANIDSLVKTRFEEVPALLAHVSATGMLG